MEQLKICFTGGGSGGHIFPVFAIDGALNSYCTENNINYSRFWLGSKNKKEIQWIKENGIRHIGINSGKLRRYFSLRTPIDLVFVIIGFFQALKILRKEKPDLLFSKGGFVSVAPVWAAKVVRIATITHESDAIAGLATSLNSLVVDKVCLPFEECRYSLPKRAQHKGIVSGVPSRLKKTFYDKSTVYDKYGFDQNLPLLVVLGGSLGSQQLNDLVEKNLGELTKLTNIVHQSGTQNYSDIKMKNYKRFSFIKGELEELLNVATLVVSRGGATALADFSKVGVPMLIIPLSTKSSRGDQIANAQRLSQNNAAVVLDSDSLDEKKFLDTVVQLLSCVKIQEQLAYNAAALYKGDAEKLCVDAILKTLKGRN